MKLKLKVTIQRYELFQHYDKYDDKDQIWLGNFAQYVMAEHFEASVD